MLRFGRLVGESIIGCHVCSAVREELLERGSLVLRNVHRLGSCVRVERMRFNGPDKLLAFPLELSRKGRDRRCPGKGRAC